MDFFKILTAVSTLVVLYKNRAEVKEIITKLYELLYQTTNGRLVVVFSSVLLASTCGLLAGIIFSENLAKGASLLLSSTLAGLVLTMPMPIIYFVNKK